MGSWGADSASRAPPACIAPSIAMNDAAQPALQLGCCGRAGGRPAGRPAVCSRAIDDDAMMRTPPGARRLGQLAQAVMGNSPCCPAGLSAEAGSPAPVRVLILNPSGAEQLGSLGTALAAACRQRRCVTRELTTEAAAALLAAPSIHGKPKLSRTVDEVVAAYPNVEEALGGWDGLVVLGSPFSVRDWQHPAGPPIGETGPAEDIDRLVALIRAFTAAGRPTLAVCLGAQLVAKAFGGRVYKMPNDAAHTSLPVACTVHGGHPQGIEFGLLPVGFTAAAAAGETHQSCPAIFLMSWR